MRVLRTALTSGGLRRLLLAFVATSLGSWAFTILFALYAYEEGGATAVGVAVLVRMLPAGVVAPSLAMLADSHSRRLVLLSSATLQGLALGLVAGAVALDAPFGVVLGLATLFTIASAAYKPAQAALIPQLAQKPAQIAAANVAWGAMDNGGFLVGSLMAGVLATVAGVSAGLLLCVVPFAAAVGLLVRLPRDERPEPLSADEHVSGAAQLSAGLRTIGSHPELRLLTGVFAVDAIVQGTVDVLLVVVSLELLGLGESGVGWLNSMWGVGGLVGGWMGLVLLSRGRLASGVRIGCIVAGVPLAAIGIWHAPAAALVLLVLLGIGYAVLEAALLTLTQRLAADDVLARVFGIHETIFIFGTALGAALAAGLVAGFGVAAAVIATGLALPALALLLRRPLAVLEAGVEVSERPFALLRASPIFAPLPIATIENLATKVTFEGIEPGVDLIRQGEAGDRFFVIERGTVDVLIDGELVTQRGPGQCMGEIALLRDQPRSATVRAATPLVVAVLDRADFLAGVFAHALSTRAAERLAEERVPLVAPTGP